MAQQDMFSSRPARKSKPALKRSASTRSRFSWFFALRPSATDAERIYASVSPLLATNGITGSRISPDRLHITLEWIGDDIDDEAVERACNAADTIRLSAIDATFNAAKTFPAPSGPCVLLGAEGLDRVRQLRGELVMAMADQGFKPSRSYEPHMTLCYDRAHRLVRVTIEPISFHADEFVLVKSHLGLSRHEVIRSWRLAG